MEAEVTLDLIKIKKKLATPEQGANVATLVDWDIEEGGLWPNSTRGACCSPK